MIGNYETRQAVDRASLEACDEFWMRQIDMSGIIGDSVRVEASDGATKVFKIVKLERARFLLRAL